jgi:hypothetical protein
MTQDDPYKKLRREFPDATDEELTAIQTKRTAAANRQRLSPTAPPLSDLEKVRIEGAAKRLLYNMFTRGNIMKESAEKPKYSPEYLQGYYQSYLMSKEAEGMSWTQNLRSKWGTMDPKQKKIWSTVIGSLLMGGMGALGGGLFGGRNRGGMAGILGILGMLLGGGLSYYGQTGKRDWGGKILGQADKINNRITGRTGAAERKMNEDLTRVNKRLSGQTGATTEQQGAAETAITQLDENSPAYGRRKRQIMEKSKMLDSSPSLLGPEVSKAKAYADNAENMAATGVNPDDPMNMF